MIIRREGGGQGEVQDQLDLVLIWVEILGQLNYSVVFQRHCELKGDWEFFRDSKFRRAEVPDRLKQDEP